MGLKAWALAARTWEQVRAMKRDDIEADLQLGAVYQHLRSYAESRQALGRRRASTLSADLLAKTNALLGERRGVRRWMDTWKDAASPARGSKALKSPFLREAYTSFLEAFEADLHDIRYGINALLVGTVILNLATRFTDRVGGPRFRRGRGSGPGSETDRRRRPRIARRQSSWPRARHRAANNRSCSSRTPRSGVARN